MFYNYYYGLWLRWEWFRYLIIERVSLGCWAISRYRQYNMHNQVNVTDLFSHWHRKFGKNILGKEYHRSNRSIFSFSLELRIGHLLVASITYIVLQESKFVKIFLRWPLWVSTGKALWWKAEKTVNIMLYVICFLIIIMVWLRWKWFRYLIERVTLQRWAIWR